MATAGEHDDSLAEESKSALHKQGSGDAMRAGLRSELDAQQTRTFTRWWNSWLSEINIKMTDLVEDVKPGVYPIKLLELLSDSTCGKYAQKPRSKFEHIANHNVFLTQLKAKSIKLVNIGAEDRARHNQSPTRAPCTAHR